MVPKKHAPTKNAGFLPRSQITHQTGPCGELPNHFPFLAKPQRGFFSTCRVNRSHGLRRKKKKFQVRAPRFVGGGFKYFLFSSLLGEDFQFDEHIFRMGWFNHQAVLFFLGFGIFKAFFSCFFSVFLPSTLIFWENFGVFFFSS